MKEVLAQFPQHQATVAALNEAESLLSNPGWRLSSPSARHVRRLADAEVTPHELLVRVGAVFLFAHFNPHTLPDTSRLAFAVSNALLLARPFDRWPVPDGSKTKAITPNKTIRGELGDRLLNRFGGFFTNVIRFVESSYKASSDAAGDMLTPLQPNQ